MRSILIILLGISLSTCAPSPTLLEEVRALGELRVVTRNSPITYYLGPAGPEGPDYDLVRGFANWLGVELRLTEVDRFSDLLTEVESGQAHLAAAGLTVTGDRARRVDFGPPYQEVNQLLIYHRSQKTPRTPADLAGKRLEVVARSSYVDTLELARGEVPDLVWTEDPWSDAAELLNRVERRESDFTVVDSNVFAIFQRYHPQLRVAFNLTEGDALAWAFQRRGDRSLIDEAAAYLADLRASGELDRIMERYYGHKGTFDYAGTRKFIQDVQRLLPRYQAHFEAAGKRADIDWRLLAALGYQESHWDPTAVSHKGAMGLMMLMQDTADLMGVADPADAIQSISGGSRYLWRLQKRIAKLAPEATPQDVLWMSLAAYNMGLGHLLDARQVTELRGGNRDRWADVKESLPLLMERQWYAKVRHGYARGWETRVFVRNIRNYYDILMWLTDGPEDYPEPGQPGAPPAITAEERATPAPAGRS